MNSNSPQTSGAAGGSYIRVAPGIKLDADEKILLQNMFKTIDQIIVQGEFGQGFSGSRVLKVQLIRKDGHEQLPEIVKITSLDQVHREWRAYQTWVEHTLPIIARLETEPIFSVDDVWGALRYSLVGRGTFAVKSLGEYYHAATVDDLCWILEERLFKAMGDNWWLNNQINRAFQMQVNYDNLLPANLLIKLGNSSAQGNSHLLEPGTHLPLANIVAGDQVQVKGFVITKVDPKEGEVMLNLPPTLEGQSQVSYRLLLVDVPDIALYRAGQVIDSLLGVVIATRHELLVDQVRQALGNEVDLSLERLSLAENLSVPNPLSTYRNLLWDFLTVKLATIHGDLNLDNILIDPDTREVTLIDFATVHQGHALGDLLRLETEVVIKFLPPIWHNAGLPPETVYRFYEQLHQATLQPDHLPSFDLPTPALEKPFEVLRTIRKMARKCLFNLDDWREYYQGLSLYLLGALTFSSLDNIPPAPLPKQTAFWAAATALHLMDAPAASPQRLAVQPAPSPTPTPLKPSSASESPYGTMHPESTMYIERVADEVCRNQLNQNHAATLVIQAPRQMGKSSLVRRAIHRAGQDGKKSAFVDFQNFPAQYFQDEDKFLIGFCLMIGDVLGIPEAIDQYWSGLQTNIIKCRRYLSEYIIPQVGGPFILAIDEVERMLTSPFQADFFAMLRTWHNDRFFDQNLGQMTLLLSSSTEPLLFIDDPHQSPFNVAEVISLQDFTAAEVEELNRRHNTLLRSDQLKALMDLVGGHPFLTRLSLYLLATGKIEWETLLAQATQDTGPFGEHLRHYLLLILAKPELKQMVTDICRRHTCEKNRIFYRMKGAGLIKEVDQQIVLRNNLYTRYFKEHLDA